MPPLLLDFDGVIADSEPLHCRSLIHTLDEFGIELDERAYYAEYLGFDDRACFARAFAAWNRPLDADAIADAVERKQALYARLLAREPRLVPGVVEFVSAAAADGWPIAVVSGAIRAEIAPVLEGSGLARHIRAVIAAEDVPVTKPDPAGYRLGLAALGATAGEAIVVEDSLPGLAAARAAGCRVVMLATSHPRDQLAGADLVWDDWRGHHPAELREVTARA